MNILWVSLYPPLPLNFGGSIGIYKRVLELSKYNRIFAFYMEDGEEQANSENVKRICTEVHSYNRRKNVVNIALKMWWLPYTVITRDNSRMKNDIKKCVVENHIDIINVDFPQMLINIPWKTIGSIPVVLNQHNFESARFIQMAETSKGVRSLLYRFESVKLNKFEERIERKKKISAYTFVSNSDLTNYREAFSIDADRTFLVPVGGDSVKFTNIPHDGKIIAFFGAMDSEMNEEAVLWFIDKIFPLIKRNIPGVMFYIIGRNPSKRVQDMVCKEIIVTGTVDSLDDYYRLADLVVIPLLHGGGVKIKLLEAVGRGKVIVSTSVGIEGTSFIPDEHILVANDSQSFAQKCIKALIDTELTTGLTNRMNQHFAENYQWETIGKAYQAKLEKIAEIE